MSTIDWERFAARVPAGTLIIYTYPHTDYAFEGVILQNKPFDDWEAASGDLKHLEDRIRYEYPERLRVFMFNRPCDRPWIEYSDTYYGVKNMSFLIDNRWQTFDQIMA